MASFHIHLALLAHVWTRTLPLTGVVIQVSPSHWEGESLFHVREIQLSTRGSWEVPRNNSFAVVAEAAACSDQSFVLRTHEGRDLPGSSWYTKDRQDPQPKPVIISQGAAVQVCMNSGYSHELTFPFLSLQLEKSHYQMFIYHSNHLTIGLWLWHDLCISSSISCHLQVGRCFLWECSGDCKWFGLRYCACAASAFIRCFYRTSEIASSEWVMENRWSKKGERLKMELPVSYYSVTHHRGGAFFLFSSVIAESNVNITLHQTSLFCILMQSISCWKMESITEHVFTQPEEPARFPSIFHQPQHSPRLAALCSACSEGLLHCKSNNDSRETQRQMKFPGFNIFWQPWPYPLNAGWHLDALFSSQVPADV